MQLAYERHAAESVRAQTGIRPANVIPYLKAPAPSHWPAWSPSFDRDGRVPILSAKCPSVYRYAVVNGIDSAQITVIREGNVAARAGDIVFKHRPISDACCSVNSVGAIGDGGEADLWRCDGRSGIYVNVEF